MIRKAVMKDLDSIVKIYDAVLEKEEQEKVVVGWVRGVYPTKQTALDAFEEGTLFVLEDNEKIVAAAKIDQVQVPEYAECKWEYDVPENEVMVLHTLAVHPNYPRHGYGKAFIRFYEQYALNNNCHYLRIDTNVINDIARSMYHKMGYKKVGVVPCQFNGIPNVQLVCLEKKV